MVETDKFYKPEMTSEVVRQKEFVIISYHRTGSTFLALKLNSFENVVCHSEIFNRGLKSFVNSIFDDGILPQKSLADRLLRISPEEKLFKLKNRDPEKFLQLVFSQKADAIGFKIFQNQDDSILNRLIFDRGISKIILIRKNMLRSYVSYCIARETGVWSKHKGATVKLARVDINFEEFLEFFNKNNQFIRNVEKKLTDSDQHYLNLSFEEITTAFPLDKIESFLGIQAVLGDAEVEQVRQNPFSLKEIIINYDEIFQKLNDHNMKYFLED